MFATVLTTITLWRPDLRTIESIATEHVICADKLFLAPNFYYSLATVCYVLTKSFNF